ncbi:hypothetical protein A2U01_0068681, partial [Trifolium medium]|nr:hypothetical protein [Trifolium medium]
IGDRSAPARPASNPSPSEHALTADRNLLAVARNLRAGCSPSETFLAQRGALFLVFLQA